MSVPLWIAERASDPHLDKNEGECQASQYKLYAANGAEIPTYGHKILTLDLSPKTPISVAEKFATTQENNDLLQSMSLKYFNLLKSYPDLAKPNLVNRVVEHG
ncbi:hypothetical protein TNCV_304521 [Trichonephila clavipes]|nr:hypothetical protein TNCV_304521 [Trichonephila clavipes]